MKQAARGLAGYGRNGDNNLVHVSDEELRGIEQLTGKKFTRNPDTGLPEAFNFGSMIKMALPIAAGIAATAMTGGAAAPLVGAAASGLTSAGISKAEGKSTESALTTGLISGVTSYAGSGLLSGVGEVAGTAADVGMNTATNAVANTSSDAAAQSLGQTAIEGGTQAAGNASINAASAGIGSLNPSVLGQGAGVGPEAGNVANALQNVTPREAIGSLAQGTGSNLSGLGNLNSAAGTSFSGNISNLGNRFSNVASNPGAAISKLGSNIAADPQKALVAAGGTYAGLSGMGSSNQPKMPGTDTYDPNKYPEQFPTNPRRYVAPPSGYRAGIDPEYRYFAKGGLTSMRQEGGMTENVVNEAKAALLGEHPEPQDALSRFEGMFGGNALALLRDRITGGRVKGAGGGMDDLIPGTIEGRQKVRLADGEFVIPSDVVSGIGDGSTDQGVRRLHEMMNKVRKERTGKTAQPKAIGGKISL